MVINLRDWRLGDDGQFIDQFRPRDAARSGTYGTVRTANWLHQPQYDAPAGGLVRLRAAITDVTRIYAFRVEGAEAMVIALDGNPVPQRFPLDALQLGPGQRLELAMRMPDDEGAIVSLEDVRGTKPKIPGHACVPLDIAQTRHPRLAPLEVNPVPKADLAAAEHISLIAQRYGGKRADRQHLRLARLQLLGDQQGAVAGRHARSDRAAGRTEARQKLCHRHGKPDAASTSDPPARHELSRASSSNAARCSR